MTVCFVVAPQGEWYPNLRACSWTILGSTDTVSSEDYACPSVPTDDHKVDPISPAIAEWHKWQTEVLRAHDPCVRHTGPLPQSVIP